MSQLPKIIVILGPTASGKTDLGIFLAKKFNGEVVNFDSRQIYTEMNIATAKPEGRWENVEGKRIFLVEGVPHHLMDFVSPLNLYSLSDFKRDAQAAIDDILLRGKLPILVGGTGLYFWSVIDNLDLAETPPNLELRAELEKKPLAEQVKLLQEKDPESAVLIDLKNPRRVLRALEVVLSTGKSFFACRGKSNPLYNVLQLGVTLEKGELNTKIDQRVDEQIKMGLLEETKQLSQKYSWDLPSMSSIGYRQIGYFLKGEMNLEEAMEILKRDTRRYAKRQMTWFKRDQRIVWLKKPWTENATVEIEKFLS